jgi:C_GCAxxG_C_C family probable redox protein
MNSKEKATQIAEKHMSAGYNCCEAMLKTVDELFELNLPAEVLSSGKLFGHGMNSGCTCGALVGLVSASSILEDKYGHELGNKLAKKLHDTFESEFGATDCKTIRARRGILERGKKACIRLTGKTAGILVDFWGKSINKG